MAKSKTTTTKKTPSYDPFADFLGLPSTNHQKKKAMVKVAKKAPLVKDLLEVKKDIFDSLFRW
jgi:hypothetical protein